MYQKQCSKCNISAVYKKKKNGFLLKDEHNHTQNAVKEISVKNVFYK